MKCSLGISNFLEAISSLSHCVGFLYFFVLIAEESGGRQWSRGPTDKGRSHTCDALMSPGFRVERGCFWLVKGDFQSQGGGLGYKTEA